MLSTHLKNIAVAKLEPIPSMYGIFTYIWLIFMVNVGKYTVLYMESQMGSSPQGPGEYKNKIFERTHHSPQTFLVGRFFPQTQEQLDKQQPPTYKMGPYNRSEWNGITPRKMAKNTWVSLVLFHSISGVLGSYYPGKLTGPGLKV